MKNSNLSRVIFLCGFLFVLSTARAQYVAIPDSNFGNWLNTNGYSTCLAGNSISGWRLDTTCGQVLSTSTLTCNNDTLIRDLTGITYFKNLTNLICGGGLNVGVSPLSKLPTFPRRLKGLNCAYSQLTSIPTLPDSFVSLDCHTTSLQSLPPFPPSLSSLRCYECMSLYCLPYVPGTLSTFIWHNTSITCMPNRFMGQFSQYDIDPDLRPLCVPASGCDFYYNLMGNVHVDTSGNCFLDSINQGNRLKSVKVSLKKNNQVIQQQYTSVTGNYTFHTDSLGAYSIQADTTGLGTFITCPASGSFNLSISSADSFGLNKNFGVACKHIHESSNFNIQSILSFTIHPFRSSTHTTIGFEPSNLLSTTNSLYWCATSDTSPIIDPVVITITFTSPFVHYIGPSAAALSPTSVSGNSIVYNIARPDTLQPGDLSVIFSTDTGATIGTPVCLTAITSSLDASGTTSDTITDCFVIHDSHDPNLKEVYPTTLTPDGGWLTYTVHFQNTGNDTAYTVIVKDTLDPNLDASSFQYLESSHHAVVQLFGQAMVFTFPKINLVDSATNPPLSEGWIQYKVKAKSNLPLQTQVKNTAYIYFDANAAVATNTTVNTVDTVAAPLSVSHITDGSAIHLYPNPNNGTFTLQTSNSLHSDYTITDMLGDVIEQKAITSDRQAIDLTSASAGVYTLSVKGAQPIRFVVMK